MRKISPSADLVKAKVTWGCTEETLFAYLDAIKATPVPMVNFGIKIPLFQASSIHTCRDGTEPRRLRLAVFGQFGGISAPVDRGRPGFHLTPTGTGGKTEPSLPPRMAVVVNSPAAASLETIPGMLRIGVLSDTHLHGLSEGGAVIQRLVDRYFRGTELLLHAGDVVDPDVLAVLDDRPLYVVRGNLDPFVRGVPQKRVVEIGGFRIGLVHGWGAPDGLAEKVLGEFRGEDLDCLVFGHSHMPCCQRRDGLLLFNPGSPTDRRRAPFHSVGILELGEDIEGRIINIDQV